MHYICNREQHKWVCYWAVDVPLDDRWDYCYKCWDNGIKYEKEFISQSYLPIEYMNTIKETMQ